MRETFARYTGYLKKEPDFKRILLDKSIDDLSSNNINKDFFLKLPQYIKPLISDIFVSSKLELSALLFYRYITFIDSVLDGDFSESNNQLGNAAKRATSAVLLGSIELFQEFEETPDLLISLVNRTKSYIDNILIEKTNFESKSFELEVAKKVALAKHELFFFYIDCLVPKEKIKEKSIIVSVFSELIFCIQLLDDINDINNDVNNKTVTYPIAELNKFYIKNNIKNRVFNLKYLSVTGVSIKIYEYINSLLQDVFIVTNEYNLEELSNYILQLKTYVNSKIVIIQKELANASV